jgi:PKD repeat protein
MLGADLNGSSVVEYFDGALDEWRIYARALSQTEVQALRWNTLPTVTFDATPLSGSTPLTVTFANSSTNASNYLWTFGDSITSTVVSPTHVYTQGGVYTVTLTAGNGAVTKTVTQANYINAFASDGLVNSSGGVITSTDGTVILDFAPGAVTETLDIFIGQNSLIDEVTNVDGDIIVAVAPGGLPFRTIELTAEQPDGTPKPNLQFQAPVTLTYIYSTTEITGLVESSLSFVYHDPVSQTLEFIPTTVHSDTLQLTGVITHFSTYGVVGEEVTWSTPSIKAFDVALSKGSATYSYDIPLPAGPTGFGPKLTLAYNSGIVNGLVGASTNPDTGWMGTGWSLELGQITWQYNRYDKNTRKT